MGLRMKVGGSGSPAENCKVINSTILASFRCKLTAQGEALYLQATLPLKSGEPGFKQQKLPLGKIEIAAALQHAERLNDQLLRDAFRWDAWQTAKKKSQLTCGEFRERAREYFEQEGLKEEQWKTKFQPGLNKLPENTMACDEQVLVEVIKQMKPNSSARRDQGSRLACVAEYLGLDATELRKHSRGYSKKHIKSRTQDIPDDDLIVRLYDCIELPHWKWAYGIWATYGIRMREIVDGELREDGFFEVDPKRKTGNRLAIPLKKEWVERFNLFEIHKPAQSLETVTRVAGDYLVDRGPLPFTLYNLRHAYAHRGFRQNIPTKNMAKYMGHSEAMHTDTYQAWMDEQDIIESTEALGLALYS